MKQAMRWIAVVAVLGVVAAACGGNGTSNEPTSAAPTGTDIPTGGTINMAAVGDVSAAFDPAKEYYQLSFEFFRCCLLRTLYGTNGQEVAQGGSELRADLATDVPQVSEDGLTWTISIKKGVHYAPPFDNVEITAGDFIRAMEREADPAASSGGYSFYYSPIEGFDDFGAGKAKSISGMTAVDDYTLQIKVTEPTGDLGWRMAMPASAPIPPSDAGPLGAAEGHTKDYGRYLVASGPYMFEGADQIDYSVPAKDQKPAAGYIPGRSIVLVRNTAWDPATDDLRPAYADRLEATIGGAVDDLYTQVSAGDLDYVLDAYPPANVLKDYSTNPDLQSLLFIHPQNAVSYSSMNLAVPPFDDVHVRKAVNWAWNKSGGRQLAGGPLVGVNAGHIFPDGLLNNVLKDYNPYATPDDSGDVEKAKAEMAQSKYDTNQDGVCDAPECKAILAITSTTQPAPKIAALVKETLAAIGLEIDVKALSTTTMYAKCNNMPEAVPICLAVGWIQDYPDAYTFGPPLFGGSDFGALYPGCCNYDALGATSAELKDWGYSVTSVPSVDDKLSACSALPVGDSRTQCWADLDKYLMEEVVPWVPRTFSNATEIVSSNIVNFSYDEFGGMAALDHFATSQGSS
jgi:peptide/nickel transport system substrate-binding protein